MPAPPGTFAPLPEGMCRNCRELRPCSCGEFCPRCMGDIEKDGDAISCANGCGTLRRRTKEGA